MIDTEVDRFMNAQGYALDAVPYDYLETPPRDLNVVRQNLQIVQRVLQGTTRIVVFSLKFIVHQSKT